MSLTPNPSPERRGETAALRVNVGCGQVVLPGYLNIDCDDTPPARPDLVHDVRLWLPFADGTVHEVRGDQFAEHLTLEELAAFLQECRRVLVEGGEVRLSFPDMVGQAEAAARGELDEVPGENGAEPTPGVPPGLTVLNWQQGPMWGHRTLLTVELMRQMVEQAGFDVQWAARCGCNGLVIGRR